MRGLALALALWSGAALADPPSARGEVWRDRWLERQASLPPLAPIGSGDDVAARCVALIEATKIIDVVLDGAEELGLAPPFDTSSEGGWDWIESPEVRDWKREQPEPAGNLVQRYLNTFAPQTRLLLNRADYQADQASCLALIRGAGP